MKKWIYILTLIICSYQLSAQVNCDNIVEEATDLYNAGRYDESVLLLEIGLNTCNLSKGKKEKMYILLLNMNIEKDSMQAVDKYFRLLLKNNPSFKIKDYNGLDDFKKDYSNYYIYPKLSVGLRVHRSEQFVFARKTYQVMPNIENENRYKTLGYFGYNLMVDYRVNERNALFSEIGYFNVEFKRTINNDYWSLFRREKITYFQWDMGIKHFYNTKGQLNPYFTVGLSNQYLMESEFITLKQTKLIVLDEYAGTNIKDSVTLSDKNSELRNKYVPSLLFGGGFIYKIGYFGLGIDLRAYQSLVTLNNKNNRFKKPSLITDYGYIDNDIHLFKGDFSIVLTYLFNKVKSKKVISY